MSGRLRTGVAAVLGLVLIACSSSPAPVEERSARPAGSYRLGDQGLYHVRRGDTLYSIAFHFGLDWKDVASWNGINRPYTIWPGQELRLAAAPSPNATESAITTRPAGRPPSATTRQVEARTPSPGALKTTPAPASPPVQEPASPSGSPASGTSESVATTAPAATSVPSSAPPPGPLEDPDGWLWPTEGRLIARFSPGDPARKGIDIAGDEGQDIISSAAGDVVYSGSGLIGFGELIIIKHSDSMLTAYAHNRRRLVQEGERVAAGSRIAEMGQSDQEQSMLHFELRIDGRPVDPLKYLPPR